MGVRDTKNQGAGKNTRHFFAREFSVTPVSRLSIYFVDCWCMRQMKADPKK
jgi:hypothetical protein